MFKSLSFMPPPPSIKIDFNFTKKVFEFSAPLFTLQKGMHEQVIAYVKARENHVFQPHKTTFRQIGQQIFLFQEVPFYWGFQPAFRQKVIHFEKLAKRCQHLLQDLAHEEMLQEALSLF